MIAIKEIVRVSGRALLANKMRSALAMLGIVIGVAAVITMFALGTGAMKKVNAQIASMGSNLIRVFPGSSTAGGVRGGAGSQLTLTLADCDAILDECPLVEAVAPTASGGAQIIYKNQNWYTAVVGTSGGYLAVREWALKAGRNIDENDIKRASKIAIIGATTAEMLFGADDPLGEIIRINKIPMEIVGLLAKKGASAGGQDQDDTILIPVTTSQKRLFPSRFPGKIRDIFVRVRDQDSMEAAQVQIEDLLDTRHRIKTPEERDFNVRNLSEILEAAKEAGNTMALLLAAVASVSLLVGGIGIMNIMLVSVTERTREIGIRTAVGARKFDILAQFLTESVVLSLVGGVVGILVGSGASFLISDMAGWPTEISFFSVSLSVGFSAFVGVGFGFYPAWRASNLQPIDALRYE